MFNLEKLNEINGVACDHCGQAIWKIYLIQEEDGKQFLGTACANPECYHQRCEECGVGPEDFMFWHWIDITGQVAGEKREVEVRKDAASN